MKIFYLTWHHYCSSPSIDIFKGEKDNGAKENLHSLYCCNQHDTPL